MVLFTIKPPVITVSIMQPEKKKGISELYTHRYMWTSEHMQTGWTAFGLHDHASALSCPQGKQSLFLPQGMALLPDTSP